MQRIEIVVKTPRSCKQSRAATIDGQIFFGSELLDCKPTLETDEFVYGHDIDESGTL
jgi:hypothetical protein